jgi:hypothetical protein
MPVQITKYKVTTWLNKETNLAVYGVKVFVVGLGWCDVADKGKGVFFDTKKEAEFYITDMKSERAKNGLKKAPLLTQTSS